MEVELGHTWDSRGEPENVTLVFHLPPYVDYVGVVADNGTVKATATRDDATLTLWVCRFPRVRTRNFRSRVNDRWIRWGQWPYVVWDEGTIRLSVRLRVDPGNKRGYGAGPGNAQVPFRLTGGMTKRFGIPGWGEYPQGASNRVELVQPGLVAFGVDSDGETSTLFGGLPLERFVFALSDLQFRMEIS